MAGSTDISSWKQNSAFRKQKEKKNVYMASKQLYVNLELVFKLNIASFLYSTSVSGHTEQRTDF